MSDYRSVIAWNVVAALSADRGAMLVFGYGAGVRAEPPPAATHNDQGTAAHELLDIRVLPFPAAPAWCCRLLGVFTYEAKSQCES